MIHKIYIAQDSAIKARQLWSGPIYSPLKTEEKKATKQCYSWSICCKLYMSSITEVIQKLFSSCACLLDLDLQGSSLLKDSICSTMYSSYTGEQEANVPCTDSICMSSTLRLFSSLMAAT